MSSTPNRCYNELQPVKQYNMHRSDARLMCAFAFVWSRSGTCGTQTSVVCWKILDALVALRTHSAIAFKGAFLTHLSYASMSHYGRTHQVQYGRFSTTTDIRQTHYGRLSDAYDRRNRYISTELVRRTRFEIGMHSAD